MSDALPQKETENQTDTQTGEPNGPAGLPQAELKAKPARASSIAIKVILALLILSVFAFTSFGVGETNYTSRHWLKTIATGGGLLPKVFSGSYPIALRAAADTIYANFQSTKGNYADAERAYKRALVNYEKLDAVNTACGQFCLMGLGKAQHELRQEDEAQKTFKKGIEAAKAAYGANHETVAFALRELGHSLTRQKKYAEAEVLYREALKLDAEGLGPEHSDVAYDMSYLGELAMMQKQYPEAIKYLSDSIVIYKNARGEFHPSYFWVEESLAKAYYESGAYAQSARQFESVLAKSDRLHGTPGQDYLRNLAWASWAYYSDNNHERAILRAKKLKALLEKKSDIELSSMSNSLESAGSIFVMLGEHKSAISMFERFLKVQDTKDADYESKARKIAGTIAQCYESLDQPAEAKRYLDACAAKQPNFKSLLQN
jgi:tetratricopeptide (TPR) repeat protein